MRKVNDFLLAVLAGSAISFGGTVFLSLDNKVLGSLFFCVGLFMVCTLGLNLYTGKVKLVAEEVTSFRFTADGDILYLADVKKGEGDLYLYTGKAKLIDEDVTAILGTYGCPSA